MKRLKPAEKNTACFGFGQVSLQGTEQNYWQYILVVQVPLSVLTPDAFSWNIISLFAIFNA
jgi:hypothetical protein